MPKCIALIPIRGRDVLLANGSISKIGTKRVIDHTVQAALSSSRIDRVFVTTDNRNLAKLAIQLGAEAPFLRPKNLSEASVRLPRVLNYTLNRLERELRIKPQTVVSLEVSHPFRNAELIDQIIDLHSKENFDSVFTVVEMRNNFWQYDPEGRMRRIYETDPYRIRSEKNPLYKEMLGLVCATRRTCINDEHILGKKIGVVPVRDVQSQVDLRDPIGRFLADAIARSGKR